MQDCLFCKIVSGEVPSRKVYEDADVIAFLDINPSNPGHTLVVPKKHSENILDADDSAAEKAMAAAKLMAKRLKDRLNAEGINILQNNGRPAGQIVNHLHFHVMPRFANDHIIISYPKIKIEDKDFDEIQKKLAEEEKKAPAGWDMDFR